MTHAKMEDFLRREREEVLNPTGWGRLPSEEHIADIRQRMEHKHNYQDDWEKYRVFDDAGNETEWGYRLKDENDRWYYEDRKRQIEEYEAAKHWQETRLHKRYYDARRAQIQENGIGRVRLTPQITNKLISLRVEFPPGFSHLTNVRGQTLKSLDDSGYHISLAYTPDVERDPKLQKRLSEFLQRHFNLNGIGEFGQKPGKVVELKNVHVTKGSTYELGGDTEFEQDLQELVHAGTGRNSHISLD